MQGDKDGEKIICEQLEVILHRPISRVPRLSEHLTKGYRGAWWWGARITAWIPYLCMDWGNFCLLVRWSVCVADSSAVPSPNLPVQWHKLLGEHCGQAMHSCRKCSLAPYLSLKWFSVISDFGGAEEKVWSWSHILDLGRWLIPCSALTTTAVPEPEGHLPLSKGVTQPHREKQKLETNLPHCSSKLFSIHPKICFWEEGLLYPHANDAYFSLTSPECEAPSKHLNMGTQCL